MFCASDGLMLVLEGDLSDFKSECRIATSAGPSMVVSNTAV